jgi:hypothetical protein
MSATGIDITRIYHCPCLPPSISGNCSEQNDQCEELHSAFRTDVLLLPVLLPIPTSLHSNYWLNYNLLASWVSRKLVTKETAPRPLSTAIENRLECFSFLTGNSSTRERLYYIICVHDSSEDHCSRRNQKYYVEKNEFTNQTDQFLYDYGTFNIFRCLGRMELNI